MPASTKGLRLAVATDDPNRLIARTMAFSTQVRYAVFTSLRQAARSTRTETRRRIAAELEEPQKTLKRRIAWYARGNYRRAAGSGEDVVYRAWMGTKQKIGLGLKAAAKQGAREQGFFPFRNRRGFPDGYYRRKGEARYPLERFSITLEPWGSLLEEIGHKHWSTTRRTILARELRRRRKRSNSPAEALALDRLMASLASTEDLNYGNE